MDEEELRLWRGMPRTRDVLIKRHQGLVSFVVNQIARDKTILLPDDAIGEGHFGLIRAVDGFDPVLKCKFSTYATPWIQGAVFRAYRKEQKHVGHVSLDAPVSEDSSLTLLEMVADPLTEAQMKDRTEEMAFWKRMDDFPPKLQSLYLLYVEGKTQKEIGQSLGKNQSTVSRLTDQLKKRLQENQGDGEVI
jgi:RNA polymerase sporulation-specific sigma factor